MSAPTKRSDQDIIGGWPYTVHVLKTIDPYFDAVRCEAKTFEVRRDDRNFQPGDLLVLRHWLAQAQQFTDARPLLREITYVLRDGAKFGVADGFVVLGIRPVRGTEGSEQ